VSIAVTDGSRRQPRARKAEFESTNGRGIALLDQLATTWEVTLHRSGKTVLFTVTGDHDPWAAFTLESWTVDS
jgi:anti-sigma regulatory factor (Ser/Thr protein kinase)